MKKSIYFLTLSLSLFLDIHAQTYNYLGSFQTDGTPNYLDGRDVVSPHLVARVDASLPEGYPVPVYNPQYITTGTQTDIILQDTADVWVSFVAEGAGYRNVLGYYTYNINNPPQTAPQPQDITIVFPNVSALYSGGGLQLGDRVNIGRFPPNTGIGWVLLANGYQNGSVTSGLWTLFSNPAFNPEANPALQYHNVLLNDTDHQLVVLGFEDIRRDYGSCDNDFNDALFYVKSNPVEAIITQGIPPITEAGQGVSSGNNGGLESHGGLSQLIGQRNLIRQQTNHSVESFRAPEFELDHYKEMHAAPRTHMGKKASLALVDMAPENLMVSTSSYVSSPEDLLGITNAEEVVSVDYFKEDQRVAAFLGTVTSNGVYDHTKTICDRLTGAELLGICIKSIAGHPFLQSTIKRSSGLVEYAISFSLIERDGALLLESFWNLDEYSTGTKAINVQVWSQSPAYIQEMITKTLEGVKAITSISQPVLPVEPALYIEKARYSQGFITMNIKNTIGAQSMEVQGSTTLSETGGRTTFNESVALSGSEEQMLELETGYLFDAGLTFTVDGSPTDFIYQADGNWGLDFQADRTTVSQFEVEGETGFTLEEDALTLERSIRLAAVTDDYISVYRFFRPGAEPMDISAYYSMQLDYSGSDQLRITLMLQDTDWKDYPAVVVNAKQREFALEEFTGYDPDKAVGLIFTPVSAEANINLNIAQVSLSKTKVASGLLAKNTVTAYPNPACAQVWFAGNVNNHSTIRMYNLAGGLVLQHNWTGTPIPVATLPAGVYIAEVQTQETLEQIKIVIEK